MHSRTRTTPCAARIRSGITPRTSPAPPDQTQEDSRAMTQTSPPRSRRSLLTAAAAAGGALAAQALASATSTFAANGDPVKVGQLNVGTATTTVRNTAALNTAVALRGEVGTTGPGGATAGVWGQSAAQNGNGVFGVATSPATTTKGVWGRSAKGIGVYGEATATTGENSGVRGVTASSAGYGVQGTNTA